MTLVLDLVAGTFVLHVGDRLLTSGGSPWDRLANKSVVLLGSDGWACFSYSGLAYIDSTPTDQWLAKVVGDLPPGPPPFRPGAGPTMMFGGRTPRLGHALNAVGPAIERDFVRQSSKSRCSGLSVEVSGFIVGRDRRLERARPFMRRYYHAGTDQSGLERDDSPRHWDWRSRFRLDSVGVNAGETKRAALPALGSAGSLDDCERILVDCVRQQDSDLVGSDCMSVVLSRDGGVRVRFLPDPENDSGREAYTPWIVAPGVVAPPMELTGAPPHLVAGPYRVDFERIPPLDGSPPFTASSQPRRSFP